MAALTPLSLRSYLCPLTLTSVSDCCWKLILSSPCWRCQLQIRPACGVIAWAQSDAAEGGTAESLEPFWGGKRAFARRPGGGGWQCYPFPAGSATSPRWQWLPLGLVSVQVAPVV